MHLFDGKGDQLLNLEQTAEALDYPPEYVRVKAEAGVLPSFVIEDRLMFSKYQLEQWILTLTSTSAQD